MKRFLRICFLVLLILGALMKYGVAQEVLAVADDTIARTMDVTCHKDHCTGVVGLPPSAKIIKIDIVRGGAQISIEYTLLIKSEPEGDKRISAQVLYQPKDKTTSEAVSPEKVDKVCFSAWGSRKLSRCTEVK